MRWLRRVIIFIGILLILSPMMTEAYTAYQQYMMFKNINVDAEDNQALVDENPAIVVPDDTFLIEDEKIEEEKAEKQEAKEPEVKPLEPPFTIEIPSISVKAVVVDGVGTQDLRKGPGLYPQASLPGQNGNTAIAGHRTTYGAWFRNLDQLSKGDEITISVLKRRIVYKVEKVFSVAKDDWTVIDPTSYQALTLTTCDPPGSSIQRLIVRARRVEDSIIEVSSAS